MAVGEAHAALAHATPWTVAAGALSTALAGRALGAHAPKCAPLSVRREPPAVRGGGAAAVSDGGA